MAEGTAPRALGGRSRQSDRAARTGSPQPHWSGKIAAKGAASPAERRIAANRERERCLSEDREEIPLDVQQRGLEREMPKELPLRILPYISRVLPRRETLERPVLVTVLLIVTHSSSGCLASPAPTKMRA